MKKITKYFGFLTVFAAAALAGPAKAEAGSLKVSGSNIQVEETDGADITDSLNDALKQAKELDETDGADTVYTVTVSAGSYQLSRALHIYSNTTLSMEGVTITWSGSESNNMLATGTVAENEAGKGGYEDYENVTLTGGTWISSADNSSSVIRMAHGTNFVLENFTVKGGACEHQMELAAIDGLLIQGVTFCDRDPAPNAARKQESLQLDIPCSSDVFHGVVEDGTPMKNVTITGCTFRNVQRGVGTHTQLVGVYHENIKITNNTFENVDQEAIIALNYVNCEISGNVLKNCGSGIIFEYGKPNANAVYTTILDGKKTVKGKTIHNAKSVIRDNQITVKEKKKSDLIGWEMPDDVYGIKVRGMNETGSRKGRDGKKIPKQNLYVSGVTVTGNTMSVCRYGIQISDARDCTVTDNEITSNVTKRTADNMLYDGIFLMDASKNLTITKNTISNMPRNGIMVMEKSSVREISSNTITGSAKNGINFWSNCGSGGTIKKNQIKNSGGHGIFISTGCSLGAISDNRITKADGIGISLWKNCTVEKISGNKIKSAKSGGIQLSEKSSVKKSIEKNSVSGTNKEYGILILKSSKVKGDVSGNQISGVGKSAIALQKSAAVSGDIIGNTLQTAKIYGVQLYEKAKVGGEISGNTITGTEWPVYVNRGCSASIGYNTLKKNENNAYRVTKSKTVSSGNLGKVGSVKLSSKTKKQIQVTLTGKTTKKIQIRYSTKKDFSSGVKTVTLKNGTKTVLKKLKSKKTYYVRARVCGTLNGVKLFGPYSKTVKITCK